MRTDSLKESHYCIPEAVTLTAERVATAHRIPANFANHIHAQTYIDFATERTVLELFRYVYGRDSDRNLTVPCSWWDHLKQTIREHPRCPAWLGRRLTVLSTTYRAREWFPEIVPDTHGRRIHFWAPVRSNNY